MARLPLQLLAGLLLAAAAAALGLKASRRGTGGCLNQQRRREVVGRVLMSGEDDLAPQNIKAAMAKARDIAERGGSPGAGLDAFAAADAAYADLINTSMDQRRIGSLSDDELEALSKGGEMWESGAVNQTGRGVLGDFRSALTALFGGAQIVKDKFGQT